MTTTKTAPTTAQAPALHKRQTLARQLRTLAQSLAPGDRMPSVPDLMRDFAVASSTAQAAIEILRQEGVVVCKRGSGTFVAEAAAPESLFPASPRPKVHGQTLVALACFRNSYFHHCVELLSEQAAEKGISVVCRFDKGDIAASDALALEVLDPMGFLVLGPVGDDVDDGLRKRGHRVVHFGETSTKTGASLAAPCVQGDARYGGYLAASHLLHLGHRRIAYAHWLGPDDVLRESRRWAGHARALQEANFADEPAIIGRNVLQTWGQNPAAVRAYFHAPNAPTAIAAWSDDVAVAVGTLMREAGLRIPGDVSLIGYDNLPFGVHHSPPLDTVDQHLTAQMNRVLSLFTQTEPDTDVPQTSVVTPTLVRRASTISPTLTLTGH